MTVSFNAKFPPDKEQLKRKEGWYGGNVEKNRVGSGAIRH
jgi:hypothetical protein